MTESLTPVGPIATLHLFDDLQADLLRLLRSLTPAEWAAPTVCPGWDVKDLAAHLLDTGIRRISSLRDHHTPPPPPVPIDDPDELIRYLNGSNAEFVTAMRRVSPPLLLDWLAATGDALTLALASRDPRAPSGVAVAWAGESESPVWFDTAREFSERWLHQQQIRDAVGRPDLNPRYLAPVLDTFMRSLPHAYRELEAPPGTSVLFQIIGDAGGPWTLQRDADRWALYIGATDDPTTHITLAEDTAWRHFTKGLNSEALLARLLVGGDPLYVEGLVFAVAIMA
jgi:uncharacterized protein (TIGR03083 family)